MARNGRQGYKQNQAHERWHKAMKKKTDVRIRWFFRADCFQSAKTNEEMVNLKFAKCK
jgi:hypothetical protein